MTRTLAWRSVRSAHHRSTGIMGLLGSVSLWSWWQIRLLGDVRGHLGAFYGWFTLAFVMYLGALWMIRRMERAHDGGPPSWKLSLVVVLLAASAFRLVMIGTTPVLSDDIYRYQWDGRVQLAGIDPYRYPPNDPALATLRNEASTHINFPHLRTVYPPLTQQAFRFGAWLGPTLTSQKAIFVSVELITLLCLLLILHRRGKSLLWVTAYAWHPLAVLEVAGSGHNDALGIAMLWLGVLGWEVRWRWLAGGGWALAFLSKYATVILAPWWWFRKQGRLALLGCAALAAWPLICRPAALSALHESLSAMTARFESNASGYLLLTWGLGDVVIARVIAAGLWLIGLLWWAKREVDVVRYLLLALTTAALLSPALHPWYLLWLIPCFCFYRVPAIVALTGTVVLAYMVWPGRLADDRWVLPVWAHVLEYAPVLLLGLWEVCRCAWRSSFLPVTKPSLSGRS